MTEKESRELLSTCSKLAAMVDHLMARIEQLEQENAELKRELKNPYINTPAPSYPPDYSPVIPIMPPVYRPPYPQGPSDWPFGPQITCSVAPCEKHPGRVRIKATKEGRD